MKLYQKFIACGLLLATMASTSGCKDNRREISDIITETAIVESKNHVPEDDSTSFMIVNGTPMFFDSSSDEEFSTKFRGLEDDIIFRSDDKKVYNNFETGDKARVGYVKVFTATYKNNELIKKSLMGYQLVYAEKQN